LLAVLTVTALLAADGGAARAQGGPPMAPGDCPMMSGGGPMMWHGMMGRGTMDPGMMDPGMMGGGMGPGRGWAMLRGPADVKLSAEAVGRMIGGQLAWLRNDRLKLGTVSERDADTVVVEIVTVDGSLVQRLGVDRTTGRAEPVR
jgi:hypothetical protein